MSVSVASAAVVTPRLSPNPSLPSRRNLQAFHHLGRVGIQAG